MIITNSARALVEQLLNIQFREANQGARYKGKRLWIVFRSTQLFA